MNKPSKGIPYAWSWNPIVMRCTPCSLGCVHCWHLRMCDRMAANPVIPKWKRDIYAGNAPPNFDVTELRRPHRMRKPATIAVQFMGDWRHEDIRWNQRDDFLHATNAASWHRYLFLTKRLYDSEFQILDTHPNWWLGLSVCTQEEYDQKWPHLSALKTAGWHTWLSIEPMLEPIILRGEILPDWIAAGPETGPKARSYPVGAMAELANLCHHLKIPFYDKRDPADPLFTRRELPW